MKPDCFFGVDVAPDGAPIVARHVNGGAPVIARYAPDAASYQAVQDSIRFGGPRPHVCIRSCDATLPLAQALTGVRGIRITMVPAAAMEPGASGEQAARFLAWLAVELA